MRWTETSRLLLETVYSRADVRNTDQLPVSPHEPVCVYLCVCSSVSLILVEQVIHDLFDTAMAALFPRIKDTLYKKADLAPKT